MKKVYKVYLDCGHIGQVREDEFFVVYVGKKKFKTATIAKELIENEKDKVLLNMLQDMSRIN